MLNRRLNVGVGVPKEYGVDENGRGKGRKIVLPRQDCGPTIFQKSLSAVLLVCGCPDTATVMLCKYRKAQGSSHDSPPESSHT